MVARISTVAFEGVKCLLINVQVQITNSTNQIFQIVGLPDKAVGESRERVRAAFGSIGLSLPLKRITVNLSPADVPKEGSHYDLPIAIAVMGAMGLVELEQLSNILAVGELALDGEILAITGALPAALTAFNHQKELICPFASANEAGWSGLKNIVAAKNLMELINHLQGKYTLPPFLHKLEIAPKDNLAYLSQFPDIATIKGQETAKRVLEIAATGGHNLLMSGPPGAGKSMMAKALAGILPPMTKEEALDVSMIHSLAGTLPEGGLMINRPYRDPHHSASMPALVGGGIRAKPGEISLAHNGVLFLDELPEFQRVVLESLRQPIETGSVVVARANGHYTYPANFQLVSAMNPCRCGYFGDKNQQCSKAPRCVEDYQSKLSGPFLDRIDLYMIVPAVPPHELSNIPQGESSETVRVRVVKARQFAIDRHQAMSNKSFFRANRDLTSDDLEKVAILNDESKTLLMNAAKQMNLSARGWYRCLRVARTIADLDFSPNIEKHHIAESLNYRIK